MIPVLLSSVLTLVNDWIGKQIGWLASLPGVVWFIQVVFTGVIALFTVLGLLFLPGWRVKLIGLLVGLVAFLVVWYV